MLKKQRSRWLLYTRLNDAGRPFYTRHFSYASLRAWAFYRAVHLYGMFEKKKTTRYIGI